MISSFPCSEELFLEPLTASTDRPLGAIEPRNEDRLKERFPEISGSKIAAILRENQGHAGQTAAALRD